MRKICLSIFTIILATTVSSCDLIDLFIKDKIEPPNWIIGKWQSVVEHPHWGEIFWDFSENSAEFVTNNQNISDCPLEDYYDSDVEYRIESKKGASMFAYTKYVFKKVDKDKLLFSYVVGISSDDNIELFRKE
jgi:hypothetical protein